MCFEVFPSGDPKNIFFLETINFFDLGKWQNLESALNFASYIKCWLRSSKILKYSYGVDLVFRFMQWGLDLVIWFIQWGGRFGYLGSCAL